MTAPTVADQREFLGRGWSFPVALDSGGDFVLAVHEEDIAQAVRLIISTNLGERVMRPDFGSGLREMVFAPMSTTTMALVKQRVERALIEWEPRIDLGEVVVGFDGKEPSAGRLSVDISYRVRATNIFYNLVYPFYLLEGGTR
jgi:phage baseplate assembly protein W